MVNKRGGFEWNYVLFLVFNVLRDFGRVFCYSCWVLNYVTPLGFMLNILLLGFAINLPPFQGFLVRQIVVLLCWDIILLFILVLGVRWD